MHVKPTKPTTPTSSSTPNPTRVADANSNPFENLLLLSHLAAETLTLAAAAAVAALLAAAPPSAAAGRHVEPEGLQDAPVRQLPDARDDPGRAPAGGQVHGVRPPHEPRPRRLRGVPQASALQVFQDHRRARGAEDAGSPPAPRRGGRLHDRGGPATARRVPRQGRRRRRRDGGSRCGSRRRPRRPRGADAPGPARSRRPGAWRGRSGPRHDAAADLAAADAEPLGAAGCLPAGRAPAAGADAAAHAAAADADSVPAPAGCAAGVPWWPSAATWPVHEGPTADGPTAGEAWDAWRTTAGDEARDATAALQAWDATAAPRSAAAWTESAIALMVKVIAIPTMEDSPVPPLLRCSISYWGYK